MTINDFREALRCYTGAVFSTANGCSDCSYKPFCDDITRVIMQHKKEELMKKRVTDQVLEGRR